MSSVGGVIVGFYCDVCENRHTINYHCEAFTSVHIFAWSKKESLSILSNFMSDDRTNDFSFIIYFKIT